MIFSIACLSCNFRLMTVMLCSSAFDDHSSLSPENIQKFLSSAPGGLAIIAVTWHRFQGRTIAARWGPDAWMEDRTCKTPMNFFSQTIWILNLVVLLIIMLLIKLENHLILFFFFPVRSTIYYLLIHKELQPQAHSDSRFGTRGLRSWKIDNTGTFLEMIIIPTHVYKLVEQVLFLWIKLILMQEIKTHFLVINTSMIRKRGLKLTILQTYPSFPQSYRSPPRWATCRYLPLLFVIHMLLFPFAP